MDRVIVEYKDGRWEPVGITPPKPDNLGPLVRHVIAEENGAGYGTNERPVFVFRGLDAPLDESFLIFVKAWATSVWRTFSLGPEPKYFTPAIPQPTDVAGAQRKVIEAENRLTEAWRLLEGVKRGSWAMRPDELARIIRDNFGARGEGRAWAYPLGGRAVGWAGPDHHPDGHPVAGRLAGVYGCKLAIVRLDSSAGVAARPEDPIQA